MLKRFKGLGWLGRALRWLFSAPFRGLPPAFGDTVPPELRAYEKKVDEMVHHPVGTTSPPQSHGHHHSKPSH
jgi:hypothetical protein